MAIEKIRIEKVGELQFKFIPRRSEENIPCSDICRYSLICDKLKDPTGESNCFSEYCLKVNSNVSSEDDTESFYIPDDLENSFKDSDVFKEILDSDPMVKVNDVIKSVCAEGFCDSYTPDCSNCKSSNMTCILRDLLLKVGK